MIRPRLRLVLPFCVALGLAMGVGCSPSSPPPPSPLPDLGGGVPTAELIHQYIVQVSCNSTDCHSDTAQKAMLDMSTVAKTCMSLKNVPSCEFPDQKRVVPGNPAASYLFKKITCSRSDCTPSLGTPVLTCVDAITNDRMPQLSDDPLQPERIEWMRQWIEAGLPGC